MARLKYFFQGFCVILLSTTRITLFYVILCRELNTTKTNSQYWNGLGVSPSASPCGLWHLGLSNGHSGHMSRGPCTTCPFLPYIAEASCLSQSQLALEEYFSTSKRTEKGMIEEKRKKAIPKWWV